ncbi:MAG: pseudouridine synthase [Flavobacteriaceae bacterium]|nr:pseudouridine synthase [Flavobacteriaceae bacterium]
MTTPTPSHFKLYKPIGYLSQFINNGPKSHKKRLLGELYDFPEGTMAIGRLDENTEGLLLLTTCGKTSATITSGAVEKEYYCQVDGLITPEAISKLKQGVEIGFNGKRYTTLPCQVRLLNSAPSFPERGKKIRDARHGPTSWISITLKEGKFRQVKKMTAAVGHPTLRLVRMRIGFQTLENLSPGAVAFLPHPLLF